MKIRYFSGTDALLMDFRQAPVADALELDENTPFDLDANGPPLCAG